jgi:hypothetical protein
LFAKAGGTELARFIRRHLEDDIISGADLRGGKGHRANIVMKRLLESWRANLRSQA